VTDSTPRKTTEAPSATPRAFQSPSQLSFRPNFLRTPDSTTPSVLLDTDEFDNSSLQLDSIRSRGSWGQTGTSSARGQHTRKFREGSLSARFQHLLKESESLELQFSLSLPRFPIGEAAPSLERSGDLLNPRNRTKYWIDLSLQMDLSSRGSEAETSFLVQDLIVQKISSSSPLVVGLTVGTRVRIYLRRDRLQELRINFEESSEKILRVYDYLLLHPKSQAQIPLGTASQSPLPHLLCTQLCELVPR
jgi:hypothetical protein